MSRLGLWLNMRHRGGVDKQLQLWRHQIYLKCPAHSFMFRRLIQSINIGFVIESVCVFITFEDVFASNLLQRRMKKMKEVFCFSVTHCFSNTYAIRADPVPRI